MKIVLAALVALTATTSASASFTIAQGASRPALRIDARGFAEVSWSQGGTRRTQLVPPEGKVLPGGRISGSDVSRPARVPGLSLARVVRRTPDGTLWALQQWEVTPGHLQLHFARWKGRPTTVTLTRISDLLRGKVLFHGQPVSGFSRTPEGKRVRVYVYLDCFRCPGSSAGWKRMLGVPPKADGTFSAVLRPAWTGTRYRASIFGRNVGRTLMPDARTFALG